MVSPRAQSRKAHVSSSRGWSRIGGPAIVRTEQVAWIAHDSAGGAHAAVEALSGVWVADFLDDERVVADPEPGPVAGRPTQELCGCGAEFPHRDFSACLRLRLGHRVHVYRVHGRPAIDESPLEDVVPDRDGWPPAGQGAEPSFSTQLRGRAPGWLRSLPPCYLPSVAHGFVDRIALRNYKSIAACDLKLGPLTFLVGPNGSGKSNFLDALRLVADGLNLPLDHAIRERGGIDDVRRRSTGHPHNVGIRLELRVAPESSRALFAFEIAAKQNGAFDIKEERCWVKEAYYLVQRGEIVDCSLPNPPRAAPDRLYLMNLSGVDAFRPLYDAMTAMSFYNLNPEEMTPPAISGRSCWPGRLRPGPRPRSPSCWLTGSTKRGFWRRLHH
ncbi:MAG: AAA family ATPase [Polyangiaceae bacterium]|nr:AAA family ATPase [Polyangiaceae bacterium]